MGGAACRLAMRGDTRAFGAAEAALASLSAVVAVFASTIVCVLVQGAVPQGHGPEYVLFPYEGELVAIGLVGGALPVIASFAMVASSTGARGDGERPLPFRSTAYWLAVLLVAVFITLFFTVSHELYGGLGLPKLWAFWLVVAGCFAGVDYWWLRGRRLGVAWGAAECYVMGTLGVFASDLVRTLGGLATAPGGAAVWGGGGLLDILFWFGLYVSLAFLALCALLAALTRARDSISHSTVSAG